MLKTEQVQTTGFSSRVDKPFDQTAIVNSQRKPQYLDVALARGSQDLNGEQKHGFNGKEKNSIGSKSPIKSTASGLKTNKVNVFSGYQTSGTLAEKRSNLQGNKGTVSGTKSGKGDTVTPAKDKGVTLQERLKNEGVKNQRLYQELDQMLDGRGNTLRLKENQDTSKQDKNNLKDSSSSITESTARSRTYRRDNITLITKRSLYPSVTKETKEKYSTEEVRKQDSVPPIRIRGSENETWHSRELKAKERLDSLEGIDRFPRGEYAEKRKLLKLRSSLKPTFQPRPVEHVQPPQTQSSGVPVRFENTVSRRHIIADIPVYLPSFTGGNQPVQPVGKELKPVQPTASQRPLYAPEAFARPVPGYDAVVAETQSRINPYTSNNPVGERLLREKVEKEKALLEQENPKYFDTDPDESNESGKKSVVSTLVSDPGPRGYKTREKLTRQRSNPDEYSSLRYQTDKEREAVDLKRLATRPPYLNKKADDIDIDFDAQRAKGDITRNSKTMDREDSWIKSQLQNTSRSSVGMTTYRSQGRGDETQRGGQGSYRQDDYEKDRNRSYRPQDVPRDRDRNERNDYNRRLPEGRERYGRDLPPVESRYERENRREQEEHSRNGRDDRFRQETDRGYDRDSKENRRRDSRERNIDDRTNRHDSRDRRYESQSRNIDDRNDSRDSKYEARRDSRDNNRVSRDPRDIRDTRDNYRKEPYENDRFRDNRRSDYRNERSDIYDREAKRDPRNYRDDRPDRDRPKDKPIMQESQGNSKEDDSKVQYVLKTNKSGNSRAEMKKSESSRKSEPVSDSVKPSSTEVAREKSMKAQHDRETDKDHDRNNRPDKDLARYVDEPESSKYTRGDFKNGEPLSPLKEVSVRVTADGERNNVENRNVAEAPEKSSRVKFLSSTDNKHEIATDRRSPWRKEDDTPRGGKSPTIIDEAPKHLMENPIVETSVRTEVTNKNVQGSEGLKDSEMDKGIKREKSVDSQGPTDNGDKANGDKADNGDDDMNLDDLNFDDIETEMDERELYVCYLVTDDGEKIGPLKLDINDAKIGLPNPEKLKDLQEKADQEESEGKNISYKSVFRSEMGQIV